MKEIPRSLLKDLLLGVEREIDKNGWDQPAFLAALLYAPGGVALGLKEMFSQLPDPPGDYVHYLGRKMRKDPLAGAALYKAHPGLIGVAMVTEAWMNTVPPGERDGRRLADMPGSVEVRMIAAVDIWGRVLSLNHPRGGKPVFWGEEGDTSEPGDVGGQVPEGLRMILLSAVEHMPDNAEHLTALNTLFIRQQQDDDTSDEFRQGHSGG